MHPRLSFHPIVIWLLLSALPAGAQIQDTVGVPDTLRFGSIEASPGRHVVVPVRVANDRECISLTIPVAYPRGLLSADSATFAGSRVEHFGLLADTADQARGRLRLNATQFAGEPLSAGSGVVAWLHFSLSASVAPGEVIVIDTGYFNDPGQLLFVSGAGVSYLPVVVPGTITVVPPNHPPVFFTAGERTVREGDSLRIQLSAGDTDGDAILLSLLNRPVGAAFQDLGSGQGVFAWKPPFTGPYSSSASPLVLRFAATDGEDVTVLELPVYVVNVNRAPVLVVPDTVDSPAFDSIHWTASAVDPDRDPVTLTVTGVPPPAQIQGNNPKLMQWRPVQADTGTYPVVVTADDHNGGLVRKTSVLRIAAADRVLFVIDTVKGYSDQTVTLQIHMKNQETLSGFELLVSLDPTAATITGIDRAGTRIEDWEMFAVSQNAFGRAGDIHIVARADINDGSPTPLLETGEGPIVNIRMHLIADELFAGLSFPARFVFLTATANTALDATGTIILQDEIAYTHGQVQIQKYEDKLPGDINLNGLAFEVGDVVYFANYFSNPSAYPLSFEQRANSDVNGDGTPATIADLVYMINVITNGGLPKSSVTASDRLVWSTDSEGRLWLDTEVPLGALLVRYRSRAEAAPAAGPAAGHMTLLTGRDEEGRARVLLYSMSGGVIDAAPGAVLTGLTDAVVESVDAADPAGRVVSVAAKAIRPERALLLGNYPNPFNPETMIRFVLPEAGHIEIEVFNSLGRRVRTLGGRFESGAHELSWDGRDELGQSVSSGVYLYRMTGGDGTDVRRMLLLK